MAVLEEEREGGGEVVAVLVVAAVLALRVVVAVLVPCGWARRSCRRRSAGGSGFCVQMVSC
jgi:hypothetical protein